MRITGTIIVPEGLLPQARELACALNDQAGGREIFPTAPLRLTADGRRWSVASGSFTPEFFALFAQPLQPRPWPFDLALATEARAVLQDVTQEEGGAWPALASDRISYVVDLDGSSVLAAFGLTWPEVGPL